MTTQVWVVEPTDYDSYGIQGVYDSAESAKAAHPGDWREGSEPGEWLQGDSDLAMDQSGLRLYATPVLDMGAVREALRADLPKHGDRHGNGRCHWCGKPWPCPAAATTDSV